MGHRGNNADLLNYIENLTDQEDNQNPLLPIDAQVTIQNTGNNQDTPTRHSLSTLSAEIPSPLDIHNLTVTINRRLSTSDAISRQMDAKIEECI